MENNNTNAHINNKNIMYIIIFVILGVIIGYLLGNSPLNTNNQGAQSISYDYSADIKRTESKNGMDMNNQNFANIKSFSEYLTILRQINLDHDIASVGTNSDLEAPYNCVTGGISNAVIFNINPPFPNTIIIGSTACTLMNGRVYNNQPQDNSPDSFIDVNTGNYGERMYSCSSGGLTVGWDIEPDLGSPITITTTGYGGGTWSCNYS